MTHPSGDLFRPLNNSSLIANTFGAMDDDELVEFMYIYFEVVPIWKT